MTISGNNQSTVFTVDTNTMGTLSELTIVNGHGVDGGGILNEGTLTVISSTISNNSADSGGGIANESGTLTVKASTFSGNSTTRGGGIFNLGALMVSASTFSANLATDSGGGIFNGSTATLTSDIIVSNITDDFDGNAVDPSSSFNLIGNDESNSPAFGMNDNQINLSTADLALAPLGNYGGPTQTFALLPGSSAIGAGPTLTTAAIDQRGFARPIGRPSDVGAFQFGPLVVNTTADSDGFGLLTLRDALNIANVDTTTTSLPITFEPTVFAAPQTITLINGTLAVGTDENVAPITITGPSAGVTISGNNESTVFTVDSNTTATLYGLTIADGSGTEGGGILNEGMLTVTASTFSSNSADSGGGIDNESGTLTVTASTFSGNAATVGAGIYNANGPATVAASTFSGNSATLGGGIDNDSGTLTVTASTFSSNSTTRGGGIFNLGALTVSAQYPFRKFGYRQRRRHLQRLDGHSDQRHHRQQHHRRLRRQRRGSVLQLQPDRQRRIQQSCIRHERQPNQSQHGRPGSGALGQLRWSHADFRPAAGQQRPSAAGPTLTTAAIDQRGFARPIGRSSDVGAIQFGPLVVNSTADSDGPGLLTLRDALNIANVDTTTTSLPITFEPTVFAAPQTITLINGTLTIGSGETVAPITITGPSGGVTISGNNKTTVFTVDAGTTATLSGLTIAKGSGADGGGIMNEGMLTVTASTFSSNSGGFGGGIFSASGTLTLTASTFSSNSATEGGGIYNASGTLTVTASTFSGNSSLASGAGIFSLSGAATISASTFSSNVANFGGGGGIASVSSTLTITGSTFTGNSAFGGGGILNESTATLTGDIILGNGGGDLAGNAVDGSSSFNLIGNDGTLSPAFGTNGNQVNVTTTELKLAPLGNYGGPTQTFALLPGSIASGKGPTLTSAATDQRGFASADRQE